MISPKLIELQHLEHLDLGYIDFNGSPFPDFIGSLINLRYLDLSWTNFGGKFPSQVGNLTNLVYLDLSANYFTNVENLEWLPLLSSLRYFDLSSANLSNVFNWMEAVNKLPELTNLTLRGRDLPSPILSTLSYVNSSKSLASVELSINDLSTSSIFLWWSNYNISLVYLDLSQNLLPGSIPDVFGNMSSLSYLDLSSNQLEGGVPHSFASLCSLQSLDLSSNILSGQLSKFVQTLLSTCAQNSLEILDLSWNYLAGSLPDLTKLSSLELLCLNNNQLSGVISGIHFSKLSKLQSLDLSSNSLVLDIHTNWIPPFQLDYINLGSCKMGPDFLKWLQTQKKFSYLDIFDAEISNILPSWFWSLYRHVTFMNLTSNHIRASQITPKIGNLQSLDALDLSRNQIEVRIPTNLSRINRLSFLDLSFNNLSSEIPVGTQLQSFDTFVYAVNPQLYGPPLKKMCADQNVHTDLSNREDDKDELITLGFYISMGLGFAARFWGVCGTLIFKRSRRYAYFKFLNGLNDWLYVRVALIKRQLKDMLNR
ncbi:unnamed protein product [Prunus armeniaca]